MATAPDHLSDDALAEAFDRQFPEPVTMLEAMSARNLVPLLSESDVGKIGSDAVREYEIDRESCRDFRERNERAMDAAMQKRKAKTFPWAGASNVVFPLLTQSAIQFQARAYPAIVDGGEVVKAKVLGPDPDGTKRARADRVAAHMTWQFLNDVPGWEDDTDRLLLQLPIVGCLFRKTWRDEVRGQNNSETVSARDFVVHNDTVSLEKAPRFTHVQRYYPHEIEGFIRAGLWEKVPYDGEDGSDPHSLVEILEQHRLIDMDEDGLPEPYVVTCTPEGHVARIVACYDAAGVYVVSDLFEGQKPLQEALAAAAIVGERAGEEIAAQALGSVRVARIEPKQYFTKYGFIPAPDGSFYDIGFGTLTENLGAAVNTIINQLIDAGTLANMQGGFIAGGTKIKGGNMRFTPGEWKRVEGATSGPLRDNILPLQLPGPNATLFQLLGLLIEAIEKLTSAADILAGEQDSQTAPTTALALIEQGEKVYTAIIKRVHRAIGQEIQIMRGLNRDYLDEREYFELNDVQGEIGRADYQTSDLDVQPVSDPTTISSRVKMGRAAVLGEHIGDPLVNQVEIRKRKFEAAGIDNTEALFEVPPAPPPPEAVKALADVENETMKAKAEVRAKDAATAASLVAAAKGAYELGALIGDDQMKAFALEMLGDAQALASAVFQQTNGETNGGDPAEPPAEPPVRPGDVPGVEGIGADAGVPGAPQGPGGAGGDPLGLGLPPDAGTAGGGGDAPLVGGA